MPSPLSLKAMKDGGTFFGGPQSSLFETLWGAGSGDAPAAMLQIYCPYLRKQPFQGPKYSGLTIHYTLLGWSP